MPDDVISQLAEAVKGLTYPSDSDEPFTVIDWPNAQPDGVAEFKARTGSAGEVLTADQWFGELADTDDADRFASLHELMKQLLTNLFVVRAGSGPEVHVYVIGRYGDKRWAGVQTVSVET